MATSKTPLRYPGGKQRLAPFVYEILQVNDLVGGHYVEPYAGGAGAALELLLSRQVSAIHLNDSSLPIFSFWRSVLHHTEEFCYMVASASLTIEEWQRQREIIKNPTQNDELQLGFSTFYLNRVNRSGVISGGIIGGLDQEGEWKMDARYNRSDLVQRIQSIAYRKSAISISNFDAEDYIMNYIPNNTPKNTLVYCDPPYFEKSGGLYLDDYKKSDHKRLAKTIQSRLNRKWILSYDAAAEILSYYSDRNYFLYDLQYNAANVYKGKEIFMFSDNLEIPNSSSLPFIDIALKTMGPKFYEDTLT
ncbi:DNA adenine methylase [Daejeonella sp.]|uniref:DNA adenine methylase n=1 Tax=Daejeonella sp. TaxID=2805397 RepID=UPI0030BCE946